MMFKMIVHEYEKLDVMPNQILLRVADTAASKCECKGKLPVLYTGSYVSPKVDEDQF